MRAMGPTVSILAACTFLALGCTDSDGGGAAAESWGPSQRASLVEADGSLSFYSGPRMLERLMHPANLGAATDKLPFTRLRFPKPDVSEVTEKATGVLTLSMERVYQYPVELAIYTNSLNPRNEYEFVNLASGTPFVTGHVQIVRRADGFSGAYSVTRWVPTRIGGYAEQVWEAVGMASDPDAPLLQYDGDPSQWPPLPEHWR